MARRGDVTTSRGWRMDGWNKIVRSHTSSDKTWNFVQFRVCCILDFDRRRLASITSGRYVATRYWLVLQCGDKRSYCTQRRRYLYETFAAFVEIIVKMGNDCFVLVSNVIKRMVYIHTFHTFDEASLNVLLLSARVVKTCGTRNFARYALLRPSERTEISNGNGQNVTTERNPTWYQLTSRIETSEVISHYKFTRISF